MAGLRRLCGRFCCVGGRISQNEAEGTKFKHLQRLRGCCAALVASLAEYAHAHTHTCEGSGVGCLRMFERLLNGGDFDQLSGGKMRVPEMTTLCTFRFQKEVGDTVGDTVGGTCVVWFAPPYGQKDGKKRQFRSD